MAKKSKHVRRFLLAAEARLGDARSLPADRPLPTVYLAGYAVESALKALVLATYPEHEQLAVIEGAFRGNRGHDFRWLLGQYRGRGGAAPSAEMSAALVAVRGWDTGLRYAPNSRYDGDVGAFLEAAEVVQTWAVGRV